MMMDDVDACHDRGAPLFSGVSRFGSSRPLPKTVSENNNPMAYVHNENREKNGVFPTISG